MYFRTRVQIPAPPIFIEGLRPSNSPTRALARRFDGSLPPPHATARPRRRLGEGGPIAWLVRCARARRRFPLISVDRPLAAMHIATRAAGCRNVGVAHVVHDH